MQQVLCEGRKRDAGLTGSREAIIKNDKLDKIFNKDEISALCRAVSVGDAHRIVGHLP